MKNNKAVKVLFIIDSLRIGGAQEILINIVEEINCNKYEIMVCCLGGENHYTKNFKNLNVRIINLNKSKYNLLTIFNIINVIKNNKIEIIHTNLFYSNLIGVIAGFLSHVKIIVHDHSGTTTDIFDSYFRWKLFNKIYFSLFYFFFNVC